MQSQLHPGNRHGPDCCTALLCRQAGRTLKGGLWVAVCGKAEAGDALSRAQTWCTKPARAAVGAQVVQTIQAQRVEVWQAACQSTTTVCR